MRRQIMVWIFVISVMCSSLRGTISIYANETYENKDIYNFIQRMYETVLERSGDAAGIDDWYNQLVDGVSDGAQIVYGFLFSEEFKAKNYDDLSYVHILYRALFDRKPDEEGLNDWLDRLANGDSRLNVCKGFIDSQEFADLCGRYKIRQGTIVVSAQEQQQIFVRQFVIRLYEKTLGRQADEDGLVYWCDRLIATEITGADVVRGFVLSDECKSKEMTDIQFVTMLYNAIFDRQPDAGMDTWLRELEKGKTREDVCNGFIYSEEFAALCAKYNIEVGDKNIIDPNKPMVALTFDDGPGVYTERLLDCLEAYDAKATFFVVGTNAAKYQSTLKRMSELECEIGNHTYSHPNLTNVSVSEINRQMNLTNGYISSATGSIATVMRPPYGAHNSTVRSNVGLPVILWSIDTRDWETKNTQSTVNSVLNAVKDGDIVLMHDIHKTTVAAAEIIIPELIDRGYQLVTVSKLAQYRGSGLKKGTVYYNFK